MKPSPFIKSELYLGEVLCGLFGIAEDYDEKELDLHQLLVKNPSSTFFMKAKGESMSPTISSNDLLIVDCSRTPLTNDIVVAEYLGKRICKRFIQKNHQIMLQSDNQKFSPIILSSDCDFSIFGTVSGIIRRL
ncbi:MAG: LexA family protein [Bacteriovoracaceae bacterium]